MAWKYVERRGDTVRGLLVEGRTTPRTTAGLVERLPTSDCPGRTGVLSGGFMSYEDQGNGEEFFEED